MFGERCPDCGGEHTNDEFAYTADFSSYSKNGDKRGERYNAFFNDRDPEKRATKIGTLTYLAKAYDTMPEGKRVINQAVYMDFPDLKVQYLLEKPKQGMLLLQIGYKQFAGNVVPELAMLFYKEMERLKSIHGTPGKSTLLFASFYSFPEEEKQPVSKVTLDPSALKPTAEYSNVSSTFAKTDIVLYTNSTSGNSVVLVESNGKKRKKENVKRVAKTKKRIPEDHSERGQGNN